MMEAHFHKTFGKEGKSNMADASTVHRKYLKAAVCVLCLEKGYDSITRLAIETLTEMIQSCKFFGVRMKF